jgi:hypothetical protein
MLARIVTKISGVPTFEYMEKEIARPLGMGSTGPRERGFETSLSDMSRLAIALVNGGAFQGGRILEPATVERMEATHFTLHPALPGRAYAFGEIRRNGWRVLEIEGTTRDFAARFVIVPDAKLAYVILAQERPDPQFWRTLDNGLLDRLLPPRNTELAAGGGSQPSRRDAQAAAGLYEPVHDAASFVVALKLGNLRLRVRATGDGALVLSGAENATLAPQAGGYWASADRNLSAVVRNGELVLSTGRYGPLALYKRPDLYAALALLIAACTAGLIYHERRRKPGTILLSDPVLGLASASVVFLVLSVFVWLLAPVT